MKTYKHKEEFFYVSYTFKMWADVTLHNVLSFVALNNDYIFLPTPYLRYINTILLEKLWAALSFAFTETFTSQIFQSHFHSYITGFLHLRGLLDDPIRWSKKVSSIII